MSDILDRCLAVARACAGDRSVVQKSGLDCEDFDAALSKLATRIRHDGESYPHAYRRAWDSKDGQALYACREMAPHGPVGKGSQVPETTPALIAIGKAADAYMWSHPGVTKERALIEALNANPDLYTAYLNECEERRRVH